MFSSCFIHFLGGFWMFHPEISHWASRAQEGLHGSTGIPWLPHLEETLGYGFISTYIDILYSIYIHKYVLYMYMYIYTIVYMHMYYIYIYDYICMCVYYKYVCVCVCISYFIIYIACVYTHDMSHLSHLSHPSL